LPLLSTQQLKVGVLIGRLFLPPQRSKFGKIWCHPSGTIGRAATKKQIG
jgi:hypothetical protein